MSASLGGGKSRSQQQSESSGYQTSEQASTSTSQSQSNQDIAFRDLYGQLYGNASNAASGAAANAGVLGDAAKQLFTGGNQFLQNLGGDAGSGYLEDRLSSNNPVLEQQISQLQQDTGRLFREELNPAITSRAVGGGTLGGGRQGVAQGLAAESAARVFTQGATALRAGDVASRDAVAQSPLGRAGAIRRGHGHRGAHARFGHRLRDHGQRRARSLCRRRGAASARDHATRPASDR